MAWTEESEKRAKDLAVQFGVADDKVDEVANLVQNREALVGLLADVPGYCKRIGRRDEARVRDEILREIVEFEAKLAPYGMV